MSERSNDPRNGGRWFAMPRKERMLPCAPEALQGRKVKLRNQSGELGAVRVVVAGASSAGCSYW